MLVKYANQRDTAPMLPIDFVVNGTVVRIGAPELTPLLHVAARTPEPERHAL
jgi:hypothetical protein